MLHRVLCALIVTLLLAGTAHAGVFQEDVDGEPTCEETAEGYTCESTDRRSVGVEEAGVRIAVMDETRTSEGAHNGSSPNSWSTSSRALGVETGSGSTGSRAAVTKETYRSTQWNDDETQRTDEDGVTVGVYHSALPGDYPRASYAERSVDDAYRRCVVSLNGATLVGAPCGAEAMNEPLPLP